MIKKPVYFAPLQGYTDAIYRSMFAKHFGGVQEFYTPFLRIEQGDFRNREVVDLDPENEHNVQLGLCEPKVKLVPQVIACDGNEFKKLIDKVMSYGYKEIDLNLGCPFPMLAKRWKGAGMLPYPDKIEQLFHAISVYKDVRFSVKMRLGMERADEWKALMPLLNEANLRRVVLHSRVGKQQYKGEVDRRSFAEFYEQCKCPLVYNGDLLTVEAIDKVVSEFPDIEGVMIGRGLLSNPALALEYADDKHFAKQEIAERVKSFHLELRQKYEEKLKGGEVQVLRKLQTLWDYLLPEMDRKLHKKIHKSNNLPSYMSSVNEALIAYGKG